MFDHKDKNQTKTTTTTKNPDDFSNDELIMDTITETCLLTLEHSYFNYK